MSLHSSLGSGDSNPGLSFSKDTFGILLLHDAELPLSLGAMLEFLSWPPLEHMLPNNGHLFMTVTSHFYCSVIMFYD